jgi:cytochrome P450
VGSTERTIIDFDHHSAEFGRRSTEVLREHRRRCPLGYTTNHGGYWAVLGHEAGKQVFREYEHFSVAKWVDDNGEVRGGLAIPTIESLDLIPNELDPPEWHDYRKLLNPVFSPKAVERLRPRAAQLIDELIDDFSEAGEADLVLQFANVAPALVTVDFLGLDRAQLDLFSDPFHKVTWAPRAHRNGSTRSRGSARSRSFSSTPSAPGVPLRARTTSASSSPCGSTVNCSAMRT